VGTKDPVIVAVSVDQGGREWSPAGPVSKRCDERNVTGPASATGGAGSLRPMAGSSGRQADTTEPVTLRPAATIMLVRNGAHDPESPLEVLMVRRNLRSDFVGGAYVFPGGGVDPADGGPGAERVCSGRSDAPASALLGLSEGGLAYWVGALRECFEEAGVLLAYVDDGLDERLLTLEEGDRAARFAEHRRQLNNAEVSFLDVCRAEQLRLAVDRVHYFAHWITPKGAPRRYDTRFFVAPAPPDQTPAHDAGETIADEWVSPSEALRRHREGEIELIFPTIRNLQAIGRFPTAEALLEAAAAAGRPPVIEPRVVVDGNGVRILLPGDPGYADAPIDHGTGGSGDFNDAVRAISRAANAEPGSDPP
jgi:8-oxo-dGTP pyrophosphatase MutT (NUDIX family)